MNPAASSASTPRRNGCSATSARRLLGRPIELLVPERYRGTARRPTRRLLRRPPTSGRWARAWNCTAGARTAAKSPSRSASAPCETDAGPLVVASIRDVSERKKAEAQLAEDGGPLPLRWSRASRPSPSWPPSTRGPTSCTSARRSRQLLGFSQKEWLENPVLWYTPAAPRGPQPLARASSPAPAPTGEPFRSVYRFVGARRPGGLGPRRGQGGARRRRPAAVPARGRLRHHRPSSRRRRS